MKRNPDRGKHEILIEILEYCKTPRRKTQILEGVNLNTNRLNSLLIEAHHLLDKVSMKGYSGVGYRTSQWGIVYLRIYQVLEQLLNEEKPTRQTIIIIG